MDITDNRHPGPNPDIARKRPATVSEAADESQSIEHSKPEDQPSPPTTIAHEPLILPHQEQGNQPELQPSQKSQEKYQVQQQPEPPQPGNTNTRLGSVSRSISINKVRQATSELETLLTDMKALRKTSSTRSKPPVLATTTASRTSALTTTAEPLKEPSTARISYISMASIESSAGANAPVSEPPRYMLPVQPLASKRQSQSSQELQLQQQEAESYDLDRFSDAIDVSATKNDAPSEPAPASSPLPATPVNNKFSFPHQHQPNQSHSPVTSVHTLGDAISAIVNNKSNSTIVEGTRNNASPDDPALNLVPPPRQRLAMSALERQITGSSVDSSTEGYYTPAEETSTAANTPTTDKLLREKRKASAATVTGSTKSGGSASTAASAMTFGMQPMPLPAPSIASEDGISLALEGTPVTPIAHRHESSSTRMAQRSAATQKSSSRKSRKKIPFTNEGIQQLLQDSTIPELPQHHRYPKSSGGDRVVPTDIITNNDDNAEALELPPTESVLIDKFVTALARLSTEMTDDEYKRPEGLRRLHNALKAIEGWI
ncbi:hypothetical protein DV454_004381 [Geotrichum candidum]|nr:hypothetical protein DV454_004381 [Geotrichum candidum]